ncbi:2,4-dichlorophenol 6-monooxygenase isoform X2 [Dioscorea cayenensis subsp. rotundata]|nr:2,4-dichlorophenol 6-monooxygenase isoform X2 [Dioscorea cayenensis subsp. rotundata]XP_039120921.1 2,4-dichlorophenol 6-monooxygenase isoform X2 [Dioscorea cayenensis subsp. rotundata]
MDGLAEEIERLQPPVDLWRKFIYCTSLSGSILGSVDHMQPQDFEKIISPTSVAHFSQYKLVRLLLKKLETLGFYICAPNDFESLNHKIICERKILMGHECHSVNFTDKGVTVGVSFLEGGKIVDRDIHCDILVGSDGARSTVRNLVGIDMKGERDLQKLVSVHFLSRDLGQYLLHERPGMLFFIFNPKAIGVLVAHDLYEGEFVLQIPYYPPQQMFEDFDFKVCEQIISNLVGWNLADVQILDAKPWAMHAEVAENFVSFDNRVILVGDAAHRFPPAGGFGMNTGIQDAHNLAWKISSLLNGIAPWSILQTYETERRPIAIFNTELSVQNFKAAMAVPAALGLDPTIANSVHQVMNSSIGSVLPSKLQKVALEGIFSIGRAQLSEFLLNEKNPLGSFRLAKLRRIFQEGKSLQLQFPAEDLGFRYYEGALVANAGHVPPQGTVESDGNSNRQLRKYVPSAKTGSRLPHMQLHALKSSNEDCFSTLDLISGDKFEFVLVIAPIKQSYDLARIALKVASEFKVPLKVCVIWPQGSASEKANGSDKELEPWSNYIDVEEVRRSPSVSWWDMCQMTSKGVILVRPDDHVAWTAESDAVKDPLLEMERVFTIILKRE